MATLNQLTRDVLDKIFAPELREEAAELLETECGSQRVLRDALDTEMQRIWLAVLRLSKGDMDELIMVIALAQLDYRDLLMASGFGNRSSDATAWANGIVAGTIEPERMPTGVMEATISKPNGVLCPNCGRLFSTKDQNAWTGKRHRRCGQLIELKG